MGRRRALVAATTLAAAASVAVVGLGVGAAEAGKLPGGTYSKKLPGGGNVAIRLYDESVRVVNSVANNPLSREVFTSGKVRVTTGGGIEGGTVTAGYLVGCQLTFGATSGVEGGITSDSDDQFTTPELSVPGPNGVPITVPEMPTIINKDSGSSSSVTVGPGEAVFQPLVRVKIGDDVVNGFTFTESTGGVAYSQERFGVDGCAGFAQARALVNVQVSSDDFQGNVTLYGKPFSIG